MLFKSKHADAEFNRDNLETFILSAIKQKKLSLVDRSDRNVCFDVVTALNTDQILFSKIFNFLDLICFFYSNKYQSLLVSQNCFLDNLAEDGNKKAELNFQNYIKLRKSVSLDWEDNILKNIQPFSNIKNKEIINNSFFYKPGFDQISFFENNVQLLTDLANFTAFYDDLLRFDKVSLNKEQQCFFSSLDKFYHNRNQFLNIKNKFDVLDQKEISNSVFEINSFLRETRRFFNTSKECMDYKFKKIKNLRENHFNLLNSSLLDVVDGLEQDISLQIRPSFKNTLEENYDPNIFSCIFKDSTNSLASLLYSIDPSVHLLFFNSLVNKSKSKQSNYPEALAILVDVESEGKEYLILEGLLANKEFNSLNNFSGESIYFFVDDQIKKYAESLNKGFLLSLYQVQSEFEHGPLEFLDSIKHRYGFSFSYDRRKPKGISSIAVEQDRWISSDKKIILQEHLSSVKYLTKSSVELRKKLKKVGPNFFPEFFQSFAGFTNISEGVMAGPYAEEGCWVVPKGDVYCFETLEAPPKFMPKINFRKFVWPLLVSSMCGLGLFFTIDSPDDKKIKSHKEKVFFQSEPVLVTDSLFAVDSIYEGKNISDKIRAEVNKDSMSNCSVVIPARGLADAPVHERINYTACINEGGTGAKFREKLLNYIEHDFGIFCSASSISLIDSFCEVKECSIYEFISQGDNLEKKCIKWKNQVVLFDKLILSHIENVRVEFDGRRNSQVIISVRTSGENCNAHSQNKFDENNVVVVDVKSENKIREYILRSNLNYSLAENIKFMRDFADDLRTYIDERKSCFFNEPSLSDKFFLVRDYDSNKCYDLEKIRIDYKQQQDLMIELSSKSFKVFDVKKLKSLQSFEPGHGYLFNSDDGGTRSLRLDKIIKGYLDEKSEFEEALDKVLINRQQNYLLDDSEK